MGKQSPLNQLFTLTPGQPRLVGVHGMPHQKGYLSSIFRSAEGLCAIAAIAMPIIYYAITKQTLPPVIDVINSVSNAAFFLIVPSAVQEFHLSRTQPNPTTNISQHTIDREPGHDQPGFNPGLDANVRAYHKFNKNAALVVLGISALSLGGMVAQSASLYSLVENGLLLAIPLARFNSARIRCQRILQGRYLLRPKGWQAPVPAGQP